MKQGQTNLFFPIGSLNPGWMFFHPLIVDDCTPTLLRIYLHEQLIWRTDYETIMEICQNFLLQKCYEGLGENSCIDIESGLF